MLHRAASNAYSWWWASHIKTKQSKWLEQNLQDMEEKVKYMLKLIEEDGDSFAKRAEMYYRKRPELINFVEESYKAYRALAERYEHISGELQNANTTIATIFPEQVQFALDEEDEDGSPKITPRPFDSDKHPKGLPEIPNPYIPKVPKIPKKDSKVLPTLLKNKVQSKKTTNSTSSQKSKAGALEKLDKLQKGILALQTEKEFVKGSYESRLANYWEIEKRITEMQEEVCGLKDEFNVGMVIEDDEARTLMAATALKSCQETLIQLQEKQELSAEETRLEQQRIKAAHEKLESLKDEFLNNRMDQQMLPEKEPITEDPTLKNVEQERLELESLREKICQHFETNSGASLDVAEVAEKIDELVTKVIGLETAVSSQTSLIKRLRLETDELHAKLQGLEENKETLIKGSNNLNKKLKELEGELHAIEDLNKNVEDQNNNLQTHFTEAHCNFEYVSDKLKCVKELEEGVESRDPFQAEGAVTPNVESHKDFEEQEETTGTPFVESVSTIDKIKTVEDDRGINLCVKDQEKHDSSETEDSVLHVEPHEQDEEDQPNWKQLFLNGLEDREKILLAEYTSILRNYKEAKKKLCESERKNRDSIFETTVRIKELKSANDMKDEEIRSLHQKLNILQTSCDKNSDTHLSESEDLKMGKPTDEMVDGLISESSNIPKMNSDEKQIFNMLEDQHLDDTTRLNESNVEEQEEIKVILADKPQTVSTIEEKFRRDIDELLEENLEFWLRFSTSFHQIQKIQTTVQDLRGECSRLKGKKMQQESTTMDQSLRSDARSIYKHLREIQTELTLWLEQSALLKDELKCRFSSLCKIQEEISRVLKDSSETEDVEFTSYQAAKFQGEVLNMQQENNKVADELQAGLDHGKGFQFEIEKTLSKLNEDFKVSVSGSGLKNHHKMKHSISQTRIPLRSFIFGNKQKKHKPKIFLWMNPTLNKQGVGGDAEGRPVRM